MITQDKQLHKGLKKLGILLGLSIPIVAFYAQQSLAIPLGSVLDEMGRRAIESLFGVDSNPQQLPPNQQIDTPQEPGYPDTYPSTSPTYPPNNPADPPPSVNSSGDYPQLFKRRK